MEDTVYDDGEKKGTTPLVAEGSGSGGVRPSVYCLEDAATLFTMMEKKTTPVVPKL